MPIAALFSGTLWLGNAAYIYLSVAFIQMLKATMPVTVFLVGVMLGTEKYSNSYAANMVVVAIGVAVASYGARSSGRVCLPDRCTAGRSHERPVQRSAH